MSRGLKDVKAMSHADILRKSDPDREDSCTQWGIQDIQRMFYVIVKTLDFFFQ